MTERFEIENSRTEGYSVYFSEQGGEGFAIIDDPEGNKYPASLKNGDVVTLYKDNSKKVTLLEGVFVEEHVSKAYLQTLDEVTFEGKKTKYIIPTGVLRKFFQANFYMQLDRNLDTSPKQEPT